MTAGSAPASVVADFMCQHDRHRVPGYLAEHYQMGVLVRVFPDGIGV